jgi:fructuronate reductase
VSAPRLSERTLARLPSGVVMPASRPRASGIVHLGIGAFHRAHQAVMTEAAIAAGDADWGIVGASLRSADTRDALMPQDGLYAVAVRDASGERLQVIGAIREILVAPEDPERLIATMADPSIRIVTLTVTEKGYCHDPATGDLNARHPDILHDLAHPDAPRSAPGFIVAALARRLAAGIPPFTVLCCDNLPANGRTVHRVLSQLAEMRAPALGAHVRGHVSCPSTMVDRIVPATTDEDRARVASASGVSDAWPVVTEPFTQWVIEDRFPLGRPRWELAGAQFVDDVGPFELMKLRLLNGAHSSLAYLGLLMGHTFVFEASGDAALARFVEGLWGEIRPTVPTPPGVDLERYCEALLERFRNPAIRHRLAQIAMDGSQKLPQRLLHAVRANLAQGRSIRHLSLAVAAFAFHASGVDRAGGATTVKDPLAAELAHALDGLPSDPGPAIRRFLAITPIFGDDLSVDGSFRDAVLDGVARLSRDPIDLGIG